MANDEYTQSVQLPDGAVLTTRGHQDQYFVHRDGSSPHKISLQKAVLLYQRHGAVEQNLLWRKPKRTTKKKQREPVSESAAWRAELRTKLGYPPEGE